MSITITKPEKQTRIRAMIIGVLLLAVFLSLWQLAITAWLVHGAGPYPGAHRHPCHRNFFGPVLLSRHNKRGYFLAPHY